MWRRIFIISTFVVVLDNAVEATYCERLEQRNKYVPKHRYISIEDKLQNVSLYWNTNDSRAAAALLTVVLRHFMGYQGVYLHQKSMEALQVNEVMLSLTNPFQPPKFLTNLKDNSDMIRSGNVAFRQKNFYVHIPDKFRNLKQCINVTTWSFYHNFTALKDCGFFLTHNDNYERENNQYVNLYILNEDSKKMLETVRPYTVPFSNVIIKGCLDILQMLTTGSYSFLLFDDDIWSENPYLSKLQQPSCKNIASTEGTHIHIHLANASLLLEYAPSIYGIGSLVFSLKHLRVILRKQNIKKDVEEAACEWALENISEVKKWTERHMTLHENHYSIIHFYDDNDNDTKLNTILPDLLVYQLAPNHFNYKTTFVVSFYQYHVHYSKIKDVLDNFMKDKDTCLTRVRQQLLGAVLGINKNISAVIKDVEDFNLPVILYDAVGVNIKSKKSIWLSTGNTHHIALALQNFVLDMNWTHVEVISELTETAENFYHDLKDVGGFKMQEYSVQSITTQIEAEGLLLELESKNAPVIVLNMNYENTFNILSAAERLNLRNVFIVRDWRPNNKILNVTCINISFLYRKNKYVENKDGWLIFRQQMKNILWPDLKWPVQAPAFVDAVLTLVKGFEPVFRRYPQGRHDVHSERVLREFERSIAEEKILGVTQSLLYDNKRHTLKETEVILEEWIDMQSELLARYRVYQTTRDVHIQKKGANYYKYAQVLDDQTSKECYFYDIHIFPRNCYDVIICILLGSVLTIFVLWLTFLILSRPIYHRVNR